MDGHANDTESYTSHKKILTNESVAPDKIYKVGRLI